MVLAPVFVAGPRLGAVGTGQEASARSAELEKARISLLELLVAQKTGGGLVVGRCQSIGKVLDPYGMPMILERRKGEEGGRGRKGNKPCRVISTVVCSRMTLMSS